MKIISSFLRPDFPILNSISCFVAVCYANIERRQTTSPSVIIIGAGMAGIAAARALHDASFQVFKREHLIIIYVIFYAPFLLWVNISTT